MKMLLIGLKDNVMILLESFFNLSSHIGMEATKVMFALFDNDTDRSQALGWTTRVGLLHDLRGLLKEWLLHKAHG